MIREQSDGYLAHDILPGDYELPVAAANVNQLVEAELPEDLAQQTSNMLAIKENHPSKPPEAARPRLPPATDKRAIRYAGSEAAKPRQASIFRQELAVSPEPMLKGPDWKFYEQNFISLTKIRHHTPPLVSAEGGCSYDPVRKRYVGL